MANNRGLLGDSWAFTEALGDGTLAAYDRFEQAKDQATTEGRSAEFFGDMAGGALFEVGSILVPVGLVAKAGKLGKVASVAEDVADVAKTAKKVENAEEVFGATQKAKAASVNSVIKEFDEKVSPIQRCPVADVDVGVKNINGLGRVEGNFSAINPGPLPNNMADTFAGGRYQAVTLEKDTILSRAGTADQPLGQFFDLDKPSSVVQTRIDKAVLPVWPGGAKSPIDTAFEVKIPAKTEVYVGEVGSQGGVFVGGTQQIVVPKPWAIDGIEVINSSPLK